MPITHATSGTDPEMSLAYPDGSLIVRAKQIPWTPWGMPGRFMGMPAVGLEVTAATWGNREF